MHGWLKNRFNPSNESVIAMRGSSQISVMGQKETGENRSGGTSNFAGDLSRGMGAGGAGGAGGGGRWEVGGVAVFVTTYKR